MGMTPQQNHEKAVRMLKPVLDEQAEWLTRLLRGLFYPDQLKAEDKDLPLLPAYNDWLGDVRGHSLLDAELIEKVIRIQSECENLARQALAVAHVKNALALEQFDRLMWSYNEFIALLHHIGGDYMIAESGIDALTGLHNIQALHRDLVRELDRLARRGNPFCVVLLQIDDHEARFKNVPDESLHDVLRQVSAHIKTTMRTFDDAYRLDMSEFVMVLKHTGTPGGAAAANRLRRLLRENPVLIDGDSQGLPVTLSFCVAEPVPGDDIGRLLDNMRQDLSRYDEEGDKALEYVEQSPLKRFILEQE